MRIVTLCVLLATACATPKSAAPATPPGVSPAESCVNHCPPGYAMTSAHGQNGCWKDGAGPVPEDYEAFCCQDSHFWLWRLKPAAGVGGLVPARDADEDHWLTSRLAGCAPEQYLAVGVDGRKRCEKIVRGADGCPNGNMRTDSRGRKACLHGDVDLAKWPLEKAVPGPCPEDTRYECWYFVEEDPRPTTRAK